jgi:DNA-binding CsgD family transcriptional regulator
MLEEHRWDSEELTRRMRMATAVLRANRTPDEAAMADMLEVMRSIDVGDFGRAEAMALTSLSLGPAIGGLAGGFLRLLIDIAARLGRTEDVLLRADELFALFPTGTRPTAVQSGRATVRLLGGDAAAALDALRSGPIPASSDPEAPSLQARALEIEALVALDRRDEAREAAVVLAQLVDGLPSPRMQMLSARCRALVEPGADDALWEAALDHGRRSEDVWELARTLLLYGERLRRDRRIIDSRVPLREAADIFRRTGAAAWAQRAERELAAAGEVSNPARVTSVDLTPQELRIALAVAEGMRNDDIAASVFLSVKTVETHLTRIYRKLGVRSRGGVAKALADAGRPT